jgi:menaquinone-dependent protoporphyrinogen oxidase
MATQVLIVYGSTYGQTAKIAERLQQLLASRGAFVATFRGDKLPATLRLEDYDAILVGASLIRGQYQKYIEQFVIKHRRELQRVTTAFFAVSGSAAGTASEQQIAFDCMKAFCMKTGWVPTLSASFGGAMSFTKYNVLLRWLMKRISQKKGGPVDTSRDHELTNWAQVEEFARELVTQVHARNPEAFGMMIGSEFLQGVR